MRKRVIKRNLKNRVLKRRRRIQALGTRARRVVTRIKGARRKSHRHRRKKKVKRRVKRRVNLNRPHPRRSRSISALLTLLKKTSI